MQPWWLLYLAVGCFALAAGACALASRQMRQGWSDDLRGKPWWSRWGRPMWDDFEPAGQRWLLVQWGCLAVFGLCLLAFALTAR